MKRGLVTAALAAGALLAVSGGASPASSSSTASSFVAQADGYVSAAAPRTSYGRGRTLLLRSKPRAWAYLRFRVGGLAGGVAAARLRVFSTGGKSGTLQVRAVARRSWTERSLTFRAAPRLQRVIATARVRRGWTTIDVSKLVDAAGTVELGLVARSGTLSLSSRETGRKPRLLVDTAPLVLAAGDIASCGSTGDEATAKLLQGQTATVAAVGDLAYESGTPAEFATCYDPSWGAFKAETRPAVGNHEYQTPGATGYYAYFGAAAGPAGLGYYSYDLGTWHVVVLNSNCAFVSCAAGSAQEAWLRSDLAGHPAACTLAYWHHPLFSSSPGTPDPAVRPLYQALYDAGTDVLLTGHAHNYQRFAPQTPLGAADPARGVREFVVGTGGKSHTSLGSRIANRQAANDTTFGVLGLTLLPNGYRWRFLPVAGSAFTDGGSGTCH
jgi:hypothetical protein